MAGAPLGRRAARERALELLYEQAMKDRPLAVILNELEMPPDEYTGALLATVQAHRQGAEQRIEAHAEGWTIERLALVDRLIMVLALCELSMQDAPPKAVVLDEYVELARAFSTDASPGFVNGVLAACLKDPSAR